jgi:type I restriction enzyme M protein
VTKEVCYYEQPKREGSNYSKSKPILFEEFSHCLSWFNDQKETERAWRVPVAEIIADGYNLDRRNPNTKDNLEHLPPNKLAADILAKEEHILSILSNIRVLLEKKP